MSLAAMDQTETSKFPRSRSIIEWPGLRGIIPLLIVGAVGACGAAPPLSGVVSVSAGGNFVCSLQADGTAKCWGDNTAGQLGNDSTTGSATPVTVSGITGAIAVSAGWNHACALLVSGAVWCWGLGYSTKPEPVSAVAGAVAVAAGGDDRVLGSCALLADGTVTCWGSSPGAVGLSPGAISRFGAGIGVSVGLHQACGATAAGSVQCWGSDVSALTNPPPASTATAVPINGLAGVTSISDGLAFICALVTGGTVQCWQTSRAPMPVDGLTEVVEIASSKASHTCATRAGGDVACWGTNNAGQLGDGSILDSTTPVTVSGITTAISVSAGIEYTCAILAGGTVKCWGNNGSGCLGDGTTNDSHVPVVVRGS